MSCDPDRGWENALDSGDVDERMVGADLAPAAGGGEPPAARWGSRTTLWPRRLAGDIDNLAESDLPDIVDGRDRRGGAGLQLERNDHPAGAPQSKYQARRDYALHAVASRFGLPAEFVRDVLLGDHATRAERTAVLNSHQLDQLQAVYLSEHDRDAALFPDIFPRPAATPPSVPVPVFVCDACGAAICDGRCGCS